MLQRGEKFERVLVDLISRLASEQGFSQTDFARIAFGTSGVNTWSHSRCGYGKGRGKKFRKFTVAEMHAAAEVLGVTADELIGAASLVLRELEERRRFTNDLEAFRQNV